MSVDEKGCYCGALGGEAKLRGEDDCDVGASRYGLCRIWSWVEIDIEFPECLEVIGGGSVDGEKCGSDEGIEEGELMGGVERQ